MPLNRRDFMAGMGVTAGVLMSPAVGLAQGGSPEPSSVPKSSTQSQVPGIYRTKIGSIRMTSVFDGGMEMGAKIVNHPEQDKINQLKEKAFLSAETPSIPGFLNTFVIDTGKKRILVDTGALNYGPNTGHLIPHLNAAGFSVSDIDEVYLTHAHPDHISGLLDKSGQKVFPKAQIRISDTELAFWYDDAQKAKMPDKAGAFDAARKNLDPYKQTQQIETFKPGADLGGGIISVDLRGHTPGHCGFRISDGNAQTLIWGDIVHMQILQFTHPEWSLTFDVDPEQAIKTRKKIMDEVATDKLRIAGMHLSFPGLGHVERSGEAYALVPQIWEAVL